MRRTGPAVALLAAALLAAGCGAPNTDEPRGGSDSHAHEDLEVAPASPTWDAQSAATAEQVAYDAMTAYASPPDGWWDRVRPYLTPDSASLYALVPAEEIEATRLRVSSPASLTAVEDGTASHAAVDVPTNAGTVTVRLVRDRQDGPWLVREFDLPQENA